MDAYNDLHREAEAAINALPTTTDPELKHALFRAIHNVKGNAGMMQLEPIVAFTHEMEELVSALRRGSLVLHPMISELLLIGLDRLQDLHQAELFGGTSVETNAIALLQNSFKAIAGADQLEAQSIAEESLNTLAQGIQSPPTTIVVPLDSLDARDLEDQGNIDDLIFFQELSLELDAQIPHWQGRSGQLFDWAMKINQLTCTPVNYDQLAAAIYMHDIGMNLVDRKLWQRDQQAYPESESALFKHPRWGAELLTRMHGWQDAAGIVLQHHELLDGSGYPNRIVGADIHPGAKILAILDNFFQLTQGPVDPSRRQSTIRALSAINSRIGSHFEEELVHCFNHIVRSEVRAGNI